jgi:hypothetical protein
VRKLVRSVALLSLLAAITSCAKQGGSRPTQPTEGAPAPQRGAPIEYAFESLDDREVSLAALKGRATVLVFIATYGDASIIQARFLKRVLNEHTPRFNAVGIFMEPIDNRPLARIFRDAAVLPYPLAMADAETIAGRGPFTGIDTVPSVVVLDTEGREVFRKVGVAHPDELEKAIRDAQRDVWGAK